MSILEINKRYSELAESSCCLSCGGAINYSKPQPGEICVDLGSGRGTDVFRMAEEVGETGYAYGIDISEGMIDRASRTKQKLGIQNVSFIQSELEKIDLPDSTANLIISNCTINHAQDKKAVWQEIFRILKPGGRFVVSDIYSSEPVPDDYKNDPVAVSECWAGAVTKQEYFSAVVAAGFTQL
jgi:ubiquinone/menaquinone biosynthesis C-methylase UbiE